MSVNILSCSLSWFKMWWLLSNWSQKELMPWGKLPLSEQEKVGWSHSMTRQHDKWLLMDWLLVFVGIKPETFWVLRLGLAEVPRLKTKLLFFQSKYQMIKRNDSLLISCWKHSETCFVYCYSANQRSTAGRESNYKCKFPISAWKVCWKVLWRI